MPYESYLKATAPPWFQDVYGQAWMGGIGAALDDYVQQFISGVLAAFPDYAPSDALAVIGDELGLDRGPTETDAGYATRLANAWLAWKYAGAPIGLLAALYWAGFSGAYLITQNGLAYSLSGALAPGADPVGSLAITNLTPLATLLASTVTPPTTQQTGRSVTAGQRWWTFDSNTDFTSRFILFYPGPTFPTTFYTTGRATFVASASAPLVWSNVFPDTTYVVHPGAAVVTDGGAPVSVYADSTTKTTTGITINASAPFNGYVDVMAWQAAATSPFADPHPADLARLQSAIKKWKPAKATCLGVYLLLSGQTWGWPPVRTWGQANTFVGGTVVNIPGSF